MFKSVGRIHLGVWVVILTWSVVCLQIEWEMRIFLKQCMNFLISSQHMVEQP